MAHPDVSPAQSGPKQKRSRARQAALLEHGAEVFNSRDLDDVSIVEITQALGYSTGSFYSYFPDKSAFFAAVQEWVAIRMHEAVAERFEIEEVARSPLCDRLPLAVAFALDYFRSHTGLVRSALRYERRIPEAWAPNRAVTRRLVAALSRGLSDQDQHRLGIALQLAFGMLVNALLHDPGPLRLQDPEIGPQIVTALTPYLTPT